MREELEVHSQQYLEISPNILSTMPRLRPPVAYYYVDGVRGIKAFCEAEERLSTKRAEQVEQMCHSGDLFLYKQDYEVFAKYLSKNLGIVLTEEGLNEAEIAGIFYIALEQDILSFFARPVDETLQPIQRDCAILCEYIWADSDRSFGLPSAFVHEFSLARHSVNVCFVGIAIFTVLYPQKLTDSLLDASIAFLIHDIGMTHVPDFILKKRGPLLNQERMRVEEHPASGMKSIQRLSELTEETKACVEQHHERINGLGYPRGLRGNGMHPVAKICAVADCFCAMRSNRVYARAKDLHTTITEIIKVPGLDPDCIKALIQVFSRT